jgi:outer membrane receptor protein involved in Fe transport
MVRRRGNFFVSSLDCIRSGNRAGTDCHARSGTRHRHWLKHSQRQRSRSKSGVDDQSRSHRKIRRAHNGGADPELGGCRSKRCPRFKQRRRLYAGSIIYFFAGFRCEQHVNLIDGRRVAPYPLGTGNGAVTFVDLNSIPRAAIESIEVLKDSASSIYGADAVAGVVNIKLRHDYRGTEANIEYGNTLDKDSAEYSASLLFGTGDGNTSFSGVLNFYHRNSILDRDRGFSNKTHFLSSYASPVNLQLSRDAVLAAGVSPAALPDRDTFFGRAPRFTNGTAPATDYVYLPFRVADFNANACSVALPDSQRYGGFLNATHKLFGDQMVLYADALYQNVQTRYELAPTATGDFQTPVMSRSPSRPMHRAQHSVGLPTRKPVFRWEHSSKLSPAPRTHVLPNLGIASGLTRPTPSSPPWA